jgi:3-polyprenyl-4-hydroxybenzoate decarboxylase
MAFSKQSLWLGGRSTWYVQNEQEVLFQLCSNVDPGARLLFSDGPLDILDHCLAPAYCGVGSKMGIDATRKLAGGGAGSPMAARK